MMVPMRTLVCKKLEDIEKEGEEEIAHNVIVMCCEHARYECTKA